MKCPKCGATLQPNVRFCKFCGTGIKYVTSCQYGDNISNSAYDSSSCHIQQYNYSYNYSNKTKPDYNLNQSHEDQYNYNNQYSNKYNYIKTETIGDEKYLEVYVGQNYNIIKNSKFSIGTLLFGGFHLLYRKLYFYAILYFFIIISANILIPEYADIIRIIVNFVCAFKFNSLYMEQVEKKVEQIKQSNFDKTSMELLEECRKQGGVSLKSAILIPIIITIIVIIGMIAIYGTKIINELQRKGAEVIFQDAHVSGHACQEEIKLIYTLVKPKYALPVHGEYKHLKAQARLAQELGIDKENIFIIDIFIKVPVIRKSGSHSDRRLYFIQLQINSVRQLLQNRRCRCR